MVPSEPLRFLPMRLPKPDKTYILIDSNVFGHCVHKNGERFRENLYVSFEAALRVRISSLPVAMTAFNVTERLDVKHPECRVAPSSDGDGPATFRKLMDDAFAFFVNAECYQTAHLMDLAADQAKWLGPFGRQMYDSYVIPQIMNDDFHKRIAYGMAWDYALSFNYGKNEIEKVEDVLYTTLLMLDFPELSRFRVVKKLWDIFYQKRAFLIKDSRLFAEKINRHMKLKSRADYLDCDILHLACFSGKSNEDVVAITCDPFDAIEAKVVVYKSIITEIFSRYGSSARWPEIIRDRILCLDNSGKAKKLIDVQSVGIIEFPKPA